MQAARYIADRTGIICYATLPILWIFSGRNNIFLWLTGWSFSTFNIFHRHVARIATVLAIVHSIGYTALEAYCEYFPVGGTSDQVAELFRWLSRRVLEGKLLVYGRNGWSCLLLLSLVLMV